jgi:hypothetical protein
MQCPDTAGNAAAPACYLLPLLLIVLTFAAAAAAAGAACCLSGRGTASESRKQDAIRLRTEHALGAGYVLADVLLIRTDAAALMQLLPPLCRRC